MFTSFFNHHMPAAQRWAEREVEVVELLAHSGLGRAAQAVSGARGAGHGPGVPPAGKAARQPLVRSLPRYDQACFIWRLVSSNHREHARGVGMFASHSAAAAHAAEVQAGAAALVIVPLRRPIDGMHGWTALDSGRAVMSCAQWYQNAADRDRAAALALDRLPLARILDRSVKHGQRHRLVAPDDGTAFGSGAAGVR